MPGEFDLDASLSPAVVVTPLNRHTLELLKIAEVMGYRGTFIVDINLCGTCMDILKVDKNEAWMGHTDDDGEVQCNGCGWRDARLRFSVRSGI